MSFLGWVSVRRRARKRHLDSADHSDVKKRLTWKIHICSENNFPTAAGLASSAAGLACLGQCCCSMIYTFVCIYLFMKQVEDMWVHDNKITIEPLTRHYIALFNLIAHVFYRTCWRYWIEGSAHYLYEWNQTGRRDYCLNVDFESFAAVRKASG